MANYINPASIDPYAGSSSVPGTVHYQSPFEMMAKIQNADTAQRMYQQQLQEGQLGLINQQMQLQQQQAMQPGVLAQNQIKSGMMQDPSYVDMYKAGLLSDQLGTVGKSMQSYLPALQQAQQYIAQPAAQSKQKDALANAINFLDVYKMNPYGMRANPNEVLPITQNIGQSYTANPAEQAANYRTEQAIQGRMDVAQMNADARMQQARLKIQQAGAKLPKTYQQALLQAMDEKNVDKANQILEMMGHDPSIAGKFDPATKADLQAAIDPTYALKQSIVNQSLAGQGQQVPVQKPSVSNTPLPQNTFTSKRGIKFTVQ